MSDDFLDRVDGMVFDKEGNPISMRRFSELLGDFDYKVVQQTQLGGLFISTVWIGTNMNFARIGPPIIFETMVFDQDEGSSGSIGECVDMRRYATEAEALAGHHELVGEYSKLLDVDTAIVRLTESETDG